MAAPSPGYSITVRVEAPTDPAATARLSSVVAEAGGAITALDVAESHPQMLVVDVSLQRQRRRPLGVDHQGHRRPGGLQRPQGVRPDLPAAPGRQDRGQPEGRAEAPRRPLPRVHPRGRPGLPGHRGEPGRRPPADDQAQHRRRGHRRVGGAGAGQHRPGGGAAGDGGQGGPVQAIRRRRRLAGLPGHPGLGQDRGDRQGDRPGLRRGQPGGHLGAALLRDRGAAARRAGHPGLPRRPARHGDRGAGRADQRAAGGRTRTSPTSRS